MIKIKTFTVNPLEVNCYVLSDETKEAVLIDPGTFAASEWDDVAAYIRSEELTVRHCLLTHSHFDHIMGCHYAFRDLALKPEGHADDVEQYKMLPMQAKTFFGLSLSVPPQPDFGKCLNEGTTVAFGTHTLTVMHTPGHSPGCVCYYMEQDKLIFTGDTLFRGSMGRIDLPGGNGMAMMASLRRLSALPPDTQVYPGHGPATSIENEKGWIQAICKR